MVVTRRLVNIRISGVVQGVGFRPFIHRLAAARGLEGEVWNGPEGVTVRILASDAEAAELAGAIRAEKPAVARVDVISIAPAPADAPVPRGFSIAPSRNAGGGDPTDVSPDIAVCPRCLADMERQPRRLDYALTNCTDCGPRFTITRTLPYDRPSTTMDEFAMCPDCRREYSDPADRRFHAQPISCRNCGPVYLIDGAAEPMELILRRAAETVMAGEILMTKSLGGYNLIADATSAAALRRLRLIKHRPRKPFAVMVASEAEARRYVTLDPAAREALTSWRAPIVVCDRTAAPLPGELAPGLRTLGVMLPYMAFQHRLLQLVGRPLAVTSANRPGEPIIAADDDAAVYAASLSLTCVSFNRRIHNRVDDSVVRVIDGHARLLRRGRGYVPEPLRTSLPLDGLMALGADITGGWALGRGNDAIASQYIGSLASGSEGAEMFLRESIRNLSRLYRFTPRAIAVDAHPAYTSSRIGREIAARCGVPVIPIWHHHAHAAAVIAEHHLEGEVLALVLDGTGAGPDATVWGSELLRCDLRGFTRIAHGPYLTMPGGDVAARQPWRMALSLWHHLGNDPAGLPPDLRSHIGPARIRAVMNMIDRRVNSPLSCGAGRLWDAVAALAGLCYENTYEAEAPILLEGAASGSGPAADLSLRFHQEFARRWVERTIAAAREHRLSRVILTGGVMQNALLVTLLADPLRRAGLTPILPRLLPPGDASLAPGQLALLPHHLAKTY